MERQTHSVDRVLAADSRSTFAEILRGSFRDAPEWVWLLQAGVIPEPDALQQLVLAAESPPPSPAIVASRVLTTEGGLDPESLPVPEAHRGDRILGALERGAVPLRVARHGSLLVRSAAISQLDSGRLLDGDLEWSAKLLRDSPGLLVPASVAVRAKGGPSRRAGQLVGMLRLLYALEPRERLWFAAHFGEQALKRGAVSRRP